MREGVTVLRPRDRHAHSHRERARWREEKHSITILSLFLKAADSCSSDFSPSCPGFESRWVKQRRRRQKNGRPIRTQQPMTSDAAADRQVNWWQLFLPSSHFVTSVRRKSLATN